MYRDGTFRGHCDFLCVAFDRMSADVLVEVVNGGYGGDYWSLDPGIFYFRRLFQIIFIMIRRLFSSAMVWVDRASERVSPFSFFSSVPCSAPAAARLLTVRNDQTRNFRPYTVNNKPEPWTLTLHHRVATARAGGMNQLRLRTFQKASRFSTCLSRTTSGALFLDKKINLFKE